MSKRWTEAELRFLRDNAAKMSIQRWQDVLTVRLDELEKKMEKMGLLGGTEAPAARKAQTVRSSRGWPRARARSSTAGVAALQKKRVEEAERHFTELIQKYPEEKELADRARVYLAVCERQKRAAAADLSEPEDLYYAGLLAKNPGGGRRRDRAPEARRAEERRRQGGLPARLAAYAQNGERETAIEHLRRAIEEDQSNRILARHDSDFDPVRDTPEFQELLAS
jgi:tetratricopeptide (TPR) repeat protein